MCLICTWKSHLSPRELDKNKLSSTAAPDSASGNVEDLPFVQRVSGLIIPTPQGTDHVRTCTGPVPRRWTPYRLAKIHVHLQFEDQSPTQGVGQEEDKIHVGARQRLRHRQMEALSLSDVSHLYLYISSLTQGVGQEEAQLHGSAR